MEMYQRLAAVTLALCATVGISCNGDSDTGSGLPDRDATGVLVKLRFNGPTGRGDCYKAPGMPKTDYVVWIRNSQGAFVKTLLINEGVVKTSASAPANLSHLPTWRANSGETDSSLKAHLDAGNPTNKIPLTYDGITAASVKFRDAQTDTVTKLADTTVSARWDLTDKYGKPVPDGTYYFCAEVANINKTRGAGDCVSTYGLAVMSDSAKGSVAIKRGPISAAAPAGSILSLGAELAY